MTTPSSSRSPAHRPNKYARTFRVPTDQVNPPPIQLRAQIDPQGITDLADSIARVGLLNAIQVTRAGDRYDIVAGHRRYLAIVQLGWPMIDVRLADERRADTLAISLHENSFRQDLTPLEEAALCQELTDTDHLDTAAIARRLRRTETWVTARLALMTFPTDLQHAIHTGTVSLAAARHLATIDNDDYRARVLEAAASHGMTERHAMSWQAQYATYRDTLERSGHAPMPTPADIDLAASKIPCDVHDGLVYVNVTKAIRVCFDCWQAILEGKKSLPTPEG